MIDVRNQLDRYASPEKVDWHFASINNRWTKRALASAGFGYPTPAPLNGEDKIQRWKSIFSVAEIGGTDSAAATEEAYANQKRRQASTKDIEVAASSTGGVGAGDKGISVSGAEVAEEKSNSSTDGDFGPTLSQSKAYRKTGATSRVAVVNSLNLPLFHADLTSALQSAILNVESRQEV